MSKFKTEEVFKWLMTKHKGFRMTVRSVSEEMLITRGAASGALAKLHDWNVVKKIEKVEDGLTGRLVWLWELVDKNPHIVFRPRGRPPKERQKESVS